MDSKQTLIKKNIKDVLPGESPLELTFEVLKKLDDKQDGLLCRICDETGASDAIFLNPIKKYVEQGQVYTARYAIAEVFNAHIRIELIKDKGSITKQPTILPFKDNTFDLSKKEWIKIPKNKTGDPDKYTDQKDVAKQAELDLAKSKAAGQKNNEKQFHDTGSSAIHLTKIQKDRNEDNSRNTRHDQSFKGKQELPKKDESFKKKANEHGETEDYNDTPKYDRKKKYTEIRNRKNSDSSHSSLKAKPLPKLSQLLNIRSGDYVSVKAYVCQGSFHWKPTKMGEKKFFECELIDSSGTVFGSFFEKSRLINNNYYEFECLKVRVTQKSFQLQETLDTTYKLNDNLNFKRNLKIIQP